MKVIKSSQMGMQTGNEDPPGNVLKADCNKVPQLCKFTTLKYTMGELYGI